jgi:hypothetical protein
MAYEGDIAGRILPIRLHTEEPNPELRTGFSQRLPAWAIREHPRLLVYALTILRASLILKPVAVPVWGSFEGWCEVIGRAVLMATGVDALRTREKISSEDTIVNSLRQFLMRLAEFEKEKTASELIEMATSRENMDGQISESLRVLAEGRDGHLHAKSVGATLKRHKGRRITVLDDAGGPCGTVRLMSKVKTGTTRWFAIYASENGEDVVHKRDLPWLQNPAPTSGNDEIVI